MFVDVAKIKIKAGSGGDGAVTFHREKYVASGGPDGGDGGKGGDIIFEVDDNLATLADFRYKRKYTAQDGKKGEGNRRRGKSGENLVGIINSYDHRLICSLIHKFGKKGGEVTDKDYDKYIEEIKKALPKDYNTRSSE